MTFARELAREEPDVIALEDACQPLTWGEVDAALRRIANNLSTMDLGEDRRVAVFAENSVEVALAHVGGLLGGASTVPVNFHLTADEVAYMLRDSSTRVVFVGPETLERGRAAAAAAGAVLVIAWRCPDTDGVVAWSEWLADSPSDEPSTQIRPRTHLVYTSGTTGVPKGTELPPRAFAGGDTVAEFLVRQRANHLARHGTHLVVGPAYHTGPLAGVRVLAAGVPVVILDRFDPEATLAAIERRRVRSTIMVPTHFVRFLALPAAVREKYDVSSLHYVLHTGAACPMEVKRAMLEWWGPVLHENYGASETGTTCAIGPDEWLAHPGSVGRAVPPFTALVVDDRGDPLQPGTPGRLYFADATGRGIIYHNDPEKTRAAHLRPGVFTLGEIGYVDEDGYVYITDRFSDMVVSGGVNLYPAEAEAVLAGHPDVADVACIGIPHAEMGEQLIALVVAADPDAPPGTDDLLAWCRERLSHHKCPRTVELVDSLNRSPMGKLDKLALRAPY